MPTPYDVLTNALVVDARQQDQIIGALLTGSVARGDALPGADLDLRFVLPPGLSKPFRREARDGIQVECGYADEASAQAKLHTHPMNVYAYLDGQILYDPQDVLARLRQQAQRRFDTYRTPRDQKATIAFLLGHCRDKIGVAVRGGDLLKAAFVTGTSSWRIMEGLWAANDLPLPPNSSVRPHLKDLSGPPDIESLYSQLFLAETDHRVRVALTLLDWILARLA